ncbi:hypothetical protein KAT92_00810 [Candidatus Babeliales bacterium]|nr:hypothetical protein [Candidatus Babeliales bacterium]
MINKVINSKKLFLLICFCGALNTQGYAMEPVAPVLSIGRLQQQIVRLQRELDVSQNETRNAEVVVVLRDGLIETIKKTNSVLQIVIDGQIVNLDYRAREIDRLCALEPENRDLNAEIVRLNLLLLSLSASLGQEQAASAVLREVNVGLNDSLGELAIAIGNLTEELRGARGDGGINGVMRLRERFSEQDNFILLAVGLVIVVMILKYYYAIQASDGNGHVSQESINAARETLKRILGKKS